MAVAGYSYLTLAQALTQISERLDDESNIYWSLAELTTYLQETLRVWQGLTGYWRGRMVFNTQSSVPFYDLTKQTNSLIPMTLQNTDVASEILYHLLEPQLSGGLYVGTDMFILDDIQKAIERRRNQFLVETGMVLTVSTIGIGTLPAGRIPLPDTFIDVRRVAIIEQGTPYGFGAYGAGPYGGTGQKYPVWRTDEWLAQSYMQGWEQQLADPTLAYSVAASPPLTIQLVPPQANAAQLEIVSLNAGVPIPLATPKPLGIPDNFAWVVKFGALADLLSKAGQARDLPRAQYCEGRYQQGIEVARQHTSAVWAAIDGADTFINAVETMDAYTPGWEGSLGPPTSLGLASWNILASNPVPDSNTHNIRLDVVQNAPVPVNSGDFLQIGREELDVILDGTEHLALFKIGGAEFLETTPFFEKMMRLATVYNERLRAAVTSFDPMSDKAMREEKLRPRRSKVPQEQEA